ncbi:HD-GYP domain-containing protein [Zavarzinia sp. CC-PAN008]|uniref:HD-GYP domain-containing protein n=1 Tax=Zavarzinia sp. CC-PAN008 TaxID=3243332 RepID=UPI003F7484E0
MIEVVEALASCLTEAGSLRASELAGHQMRVGRLAQAYCGLLGFPDDRCRALALLAQIHDAGKLAIPDAILLKPAPLTAEEWVDMRQHTVLGARILGASPDPLARLASDVARHHHEAWDGSGYPDGLAGEAIPLEARLVAICDVYDALREVRSYKPALDHGTAVDIMMHGDARLRPGRFDPHLLAVFGEHADTLATAYDAEVAS